MKPDIIQTVTRLPNELSPAFMEWCLRGGHSIKVKKDRVCIHKDQKRGEVICKPGVIQESYAMNEYMIERFQLFSRQWLKYGKSFVDELTYVMLSKQADCIRQINLAKVA
ncbi:hypothetical protein [Acinetobacter indicus]|uniref:hypothetical protein n=1 Tax=Acinetobacter indicus TaxID=756892 RepID=UPI002576F052|nr:hypothetical protein [Acinetobacter indicus]MDM1272645.1 hypothetical protein [Acinetobacter indicus]